jgi:predicted type IV restriction endonuclease
MATENQLGNLEAKLKEYRKKYLRKEFTELNESATRIMVNYFLSTILGYKELEEIKTEYRVRSEYADYVIQVSRKKHFVVEVKSIDIDINANHLRQSLSYAANEGIDWILLMNGREIQLYRVNFGKPVTTTLIYQLDLMKPDDFKKAPEQIWYLTKTAVERGDLEGFWKRADALRLDHLAKILYCEDIVRKLRTELKNETDIYFQLDDVADALFKLIVKAVEVPPRLRKTKR